MAGSLMRTSTKIIGQKADRLGLYLGLALAVLPLTPARSGPLAAFLNPPAETRPLTRWWWFGGNVDDRELVREIRAMKAAGFGGFELQPVYPLTVDGNDPYLSKPFLRHVSLANETARGLGMRMDVTLGSGWPFGGPHIGLDLASSRICLAQFPIADGATSIALPKLGPGERPIAAFVGRDAASATPAAIDSGHVSFSEAHGQYLFLFVQTPTGQQVKRPTVGADGLVLDHMSAAAVESHLQTIGNRLMTAFGDKPPYAVFSDSLEVYNADWTANLLVEFQKRRGYDLTSHLPALFFDLPDSGAIRHDWALTLSELTEANYLKLVTAWAVAHKTRFRAQVYGFPPVALSSQRIVNLAEGEGADWRQFSTARWASSANHITGQPVTSAESWTWLHGAPFRATPLDIKAEADTLLLEGINQFVAHGWPYSPPGVAQPGWTFYAAAAMNDHNPWWPVMPDVTRYLQRMSFLLRQGRPVADVAILLPEDDALARATPGNASITDQIGSQVTAGLTRQILDAGFAFDYIDAKSLETLGTDHKIVILPNISRLPPAAYRSIADFARKGGIVIAVGQLPDRGPGFLQREQEADCVRDLSRELFAAGTGKGHQTQEDALGQTLRTLAVPDLGGLTPGVGFVHRHLDGGDLYFVANTTNKTTTFTPTFAAGASAAQWWNPRDGAVHAWSPDQPTTLAPYESRIFVFGDLLGVKSKTSQLRPYARRPLTSGWTIKFEKGKPQPISMFKSWTDLAAEAHFSGVATYARKLTLSRRDIAAGLTELDFGVGAPTVAPAKSLGTQALLAAPVREAAEVYVNGRRAGSVWTAPFALNLNGFLHPGVNRLEIRVANTAINVLAGQPKPDYTALNAKYGERFHPQGLDALVPLPSGLLEPPSLTTEP